MTWSLLPPTTCKQNSLRPMKKSQNLAQNSRFTLRLVCINTVIMLKYLRNIYTQQRAGGGEWAESAELTSCPGHTCKVLELLRQVIQHRLYFGMPMHGVKVLRGGAAIVSFMMYLISQH